MISFILETFGGNKLRKILLFITILSTVLLASCTDLEDKAVYTVSFDTSIDVIPQIESIRVDQGKKVIPPEINTNVSYKTYNLEFEGWYLGNALFDFDSEITEDVHLEARWKIIASFSGSMINLLDSVAIGYRRYFIAKITDPIEITLDIHPAFEVATKYGIEDAVYLKGSMNDGYVWITGGEIESNIYKYFDFYPHPVQINQYHLIIERDVIEIEEGRMQTGLYGYSRILLSTYDSSKNPYEQNDETLAILQPFIDAIDAYNAQFND
jgi:hypothetical protein